MSGRRVAAGRRAGVAASFGQPDPSYLAVGPSLPTSTPSPSGDQMMDYLPRQRQRQRTDLPARRGKEMGGRVVAQNEGVTVGRERPSGIDDGTAAITAAG